MFLAVLRRVNRGVAPILFTERYHVVFSVLALNGQISQL